MKTIDLCGNWQMEATGIGPLSASVPGSAASTLLAHGLMEDPYWRDNEFKVQSVFDEDYSFTKTFHVDPQLLSRQYAELVCDGLDTIADIELNGISIGHADNMHRSWRFACKNALTYGENTVRIHFKSPIRYLKEHPATIGKRFTTIRKAACMFGWDWGLDLSDCGIWRGIRLEFYNYGRLDNALIRQYHCGNSVTLSVKASVYSRQYPSSIYFSLLDPSGQLLIRTEANAEGAAELVVHDPMLWWPVGYGEQPLYQLVTELVHNDAVCHRNTQHIGLRTICLDRSPKEDGFAYSFTVNGTPVFFRGENLIIPDSILSNTDDAYWHGLIKNCLKSNLNGIRVWGGAYYPPDIFYELCDRAGILIYQDFMFACSFYQVSQAFLENVRHEIEDNLRRIAHHPCIALLCGNNEIDGIYTVGGSTDPETAALRVLFGAGKDPLPEQVRNYLWSQYEPLFLKLIPEVCRDLAPDISYVPSSPSLPEPGSAKSFFDYLPGGDMHYYLQYNGNAPYQKMRTMRSRFMTEIGFQSYPDWKTICAFTEPQDRLPYTPVMYAHQKCASGNEAIELYMQRDYRVPKDFRDYVFLSQVQAGEIMRYTVEHFRRDSAYCRGMVLWQLNDCWSVVSWSGIDYYGRWKALQYYIRRFYEPILVSVEETASGAAIWVTNDTPQDATLTLRWKLMDTFGSILDAGSSCVGIHAGESMACVELDYTGILTDKNRSNTFLHWSFEDGKDTRSGVVLFTLAKDFLFQNPEISCRVSSAEEGYSVAVSSNALVKCVGLSTLVGDCIFSDNYFDLLPGETRTVTVSFDDCTGISDAETLERSLQVNSLNAVLIRAKEV